MTHDAGCPVCGCRSNSDFLERRDVPLFSNLVLPDRDSALRVGRGDLLLAVCESCGFVFNRAFDEQRLVYNPDYDNTQTCSGAFTGHLEALARRLVEERGVRDCRIVEVGCGQGGFLRALVEVEDSGNRGWGFDPAYRGPLSDLDGRLRFERCYYGREHTSVPADVVICRHVIEHVPDPMSMLRSIRAALSESDNAVVMIETPCVDWILQNGVVWDFFYEHCSYFAAESMRWALSTAGFEPETIEHVFGGQYLWAEAVSACEVDAVEGTVRVGRSGPSIADEAGRYGRCVDDRIERWRQVLGAEAGSVAIWGAGAKGVTFANLVDPARELAACVVDLNPNKQGRFVPGTGHDIVAPRDLRSRGVRSALVLNPNYVAEVGALLDADGLEVEVIDAMQVTGDEADH